MLDIVSAIENKLRITFDYKGVKRTTEPYLIGPNNKGELMLRAYEISSVNSGLKLWKVAEMANIKVTEISFLFPHPNFSKKDSQIVKAMACVS